VDWNLWNEEHASRIHAIPGDLSAPRLGIDADSYELLAREVAEVYHCGTSMNHLETYAMAKPANVAGVRELLRFATHQRLKVTHYLSTLGIFNPAPVNETRVVSESSPIEGECHAASQGYTASKWVGEKLIMIAAQRGIPCNIFRLGLVWADTSQGRYDERQREYRILKTCLLSGYGIRDYSFDMAPTPVDYVARSIVYLASAHPEGNRIFHIASPRRAIEGLFESCQEAGIPLELKPWFEWITHIKRLHQEGHSLPAVPILEPTFALDETTFYANQRRIQGGQTLYDCARTYEELERVGIVAPVLDRALLQVHLQQVLAHDPALRAWRANERLPAERTVSARPASSNIATGMQ
jgi:thioester reductase-like protein